MPEGPIITPPFRASFLSLHEASSYQGGADKFSVTALWQVEDIKGRYKDAWGRVVKALDAKAREFFDLPLAKLPANIRRGIRNGNEKAHLNGYGEGILFAALSTDRRPQVVDLRKNVIDVRDWRVDPLVYPGCWMRASISPYAYDNIGKGVALGLNNIQWLGHGERLDSQTNAAVDFEDDPDDIWFQRDQDAEPDAAAEPPDTGSTAEEEDDIPF